MINKIDDTAHYSPIINYRYERWFHQVQYNGKVLNDAERKKFINVSDETIAVYSEGLPMIKKTLEQINGLQDEYHEVYTIVITVMQFTLITLLDSMVLNKYFILADKDYDRRLMRGKLMVVLNEGFKKLYGFSENTRKKSEWDKLSPILYYFPEAINNQYHELSSLLEKYYSTSSWWKEVRDLETHLDAAKLYKSRCEEVIESKVIMDAQRLINPLLAVNNFLFNMHSCINNFLLDLYQKGVLK